MSRSRYYPGPRVRSLERDWDHRRRVVDGWHARDVRAVGLDDAPGGAWVLRGPRVEWHSVQRPAGSARRKLRRDVQRAGRWLLDDRIDPADLRY